MGMAMLTEMKLFWFHQFAVPPPSAAVSTVSSSPSDSVLPFVSSLVNLQKQQRRWVHMSARGVLVNMLGLVCLLMAAAADSNSDSCCYCQCSFGSASALGKYVD